MHGQSCDFGTDQFPTWSCCCLSLISCAQMNPEMALSNMILLSLSLSQCNQPLSQPLITQYVSCKLVRQHVDLTLQDFRAKKIKIKIKPSHHQSLQSNEIKLDPTPQTVFLKIHPFLGGMSKITVRNVGM